MIYLIPEPRVYTLTCTCGRVLMVRGGMARCTHDVTIRDNGVEQTVRQVVRHTVGVRTELVSGGAA